jgi:ABC-type transporter Mla maintaining outer membrane lipid asymmetry ATPase subunit MlaF
MKRNLSGIYFRINNENICFEELTEAQMDEVMVGRSEEWIKSLAKQLAQTIFKIGHDLDIIAQLKSKL